jgi:hypothetical protein
MREVVAIEERLLGEHLDRVDLLPVGSGQLSAGLFGRGDLTGGLVGGALSYEHRAYEDLSLVGEAWGGYGWGGDQASVSWGASAGLRWRF